MSFPTSASRVQRAAAQTAQLDSVMIGIETGMRQEAATLAAGNVPVTDLILSLFQQLISHKQRITLARDTPGVLDEHGRDLLVKVDLYASDINLGNNRFVVPHSFRQADPVRVVPIGDSVLPGPLTVGQNLWATVITPGGFKVASSEANALADTEIDLTGPTSGQFVVRSRLLADTNAVLTEIDAVLSWIDLNVPLTSPWSLDTSGATGDQGVIHAEMTPAQTAGLQTALTALADTIEPPA